MGPGHPGQIPRTSQIPLFETQGRQTFEGGHELFGHQPFAWKTPPHRAVCGPKKLIFVLFFSCLKNGRILLGNPDLGDTDFVDIWISHKMLLQTVGAYVQACFLDSCPCVCMGATKPEVHAEFQLLGAKNRTQTFCFFFFSFRAPRDIPAKIPRYPAQKFCFCEFWKTCRTFWPPVHVDDPWTTSEGYIFQISLLGPRSSWPKSACSC